MDYDENQFMEKIKQFKVTASDFFEYRKLESNEACFIPCKITEEGEEVCYHYRLDGLKSYETLAQEDWENKYQFLINFSKLEKLIQEYKISFRSENIYYDENYLPLIKHRDVYETGEKTMSQEEFLEIYKCYIGGMIQKKYQVNDLLEAGVELLAKNKSFSEFKELKSVDDILVLLRGKKNEKVIQRRNFEVHINKRTYLQQKVFGRLFTAVLIIAVIYTGYQAMVEGPRKDAVITANQAYIKKDYVNCIDALSKMDINKLDKSTKYLLAVSYTQAESFKKEEVNNILSKLSPESNEKELDYWIYIGRQQLEQAQDIAISLSDDKLLIYAYMKEYSIVQDDTKISGQDKKAKLDQLENEINQLADKYQNQSIEEDETIPNE